MERRWELSKKKIDMRSCKEFTIPPKHINRLKHQK